VGRQRQIPEDYIPTIEAELRKLGILDPAEGMAK
jgi:hypothetical protein